jgi:hypothetical protein
MFTGPPLPLPTEFPLRQLIPLINDKQHAGAWVRDSGPAHRLTITAGGRCIAILIGQDLGELLRGCTQLVLRAGSCPVCVTAEAVIQWRALQVVTAIPHLPSLERLKQIFPDAEIEAGGFRVPTQHHSAEEVLANCVLHGIPVMESRVVYEYRPRPTALGQVPPASST